MCEIRDDPSRRETGKKIILVCVCFSIHLRINCEIRLRDSPEEVDPIQNAVAQFLLIIRIRFIYIVMLNYTSKIYSVVTSSSMSFCKYCFSYF